MNPYRSNRADNRSFRTSNEEYGCSIGEGNQNKRLVTNDVDRRIVVTTGLSSSCSFDVRENYVTAGTVCYDIQRHDTELMYRETLHLLEHNRTFRQFFTKIFKDLPFSAYVWEMIPVTDQTADTIPFQFVVTESRSLDRMNKDSDTFSSHFRKSRNPHAVSFKNLGRDATLIAPLPNTRLLLERDYSHIGSFIRNAPDEQIDAFWIEVAKSMREQLSDYCTSPLWLSTAGHGVAWLHARIDTTPKYYSYTPYRTFSQSKRNDSSNRRSSSNGKSDAKDKKHDGGNGDAYRQEDKDGEFPQKKSEKYDWSISEGYSNHGQTMLYSFAYMDKVLKYKEAVRKLKTDPTFRRIFTSVFKDCQHDDFKWELVPVNKETAATEDFQVAFVNIARGHDVTDCPSEFEDLMKKHGNKPILYHQGRHASYVAPNPYHKEWSNRKYRHIGEFVRKAPAEVTDEFWKVLARALSDFLEKNPTQPTCLSSGQTPSIEQKAYIQIDNRPTNNKHPAYQRVSRREDSMEWR